MASFSWDGVSGDWANTVEGTPVGEPPTSTDTTTISGDGSANFVTVEAVPGPGVVIWNNVDLTGSQTYIETGVIDASNTSVGTGATWLVEGTVNQTGGLNLSDESSGPWAAGFLSIASTGVYDITDDSAITCNYTSGATITNAGLFEATVGTSTANINVDVTNTGTIKVNAGAMAFGASVNNSGTITDSGTGLSFNDGLTSSGTINAGAVGLSISGGYTNTGTINVTGGTLALSGGGVIDSHFVIGKTVTIDFDSGYFTFAGTTVTLNNLLNDTNSGISLSNGQTLTSTANDALTNADVTGSGTLVTTGTIAASNTYIGTGAKWLVKGTVDQTGGLNLSDESSGPWAAGFLSIASTGVYDITDDSAIVCNYTSGATITNAGLLEATVGTSTANINVDVTNTGTIKVNAGAMAFGASVNNSGTITDSGTGLSFNDGLTNSGTINAGAVGLSISGGYTNTGTINVTGGTLALSGGGVIDSHFVIGKTVTIDFDSGYFTFAGTTVTLNDLLNDTNSGISLSNGQTLTLTANDALTNADVTGSGTLVTTGTIAASNTYIGTGAKWLVKGTVDQTGGLNLSDESTGPWAAGFLSIASTGVYDITDDSAIVCNYTSGATIANAGLFEATVGTSTANINVDVTNTGTIQVNAGAMAFGASVNNSGTITDSGTGLSFNDGLTNSGTINAGAVGLSISGGYTNTGTINVTGGTLALSGGGVIDSHFVIGKTVTIDFDSGYFTFAGTTVTLNDLLNDTNSGISLSNGQTLTLTANDALTNADVTGSGTLVTTGTIAASNTYIGTGAKWLVKGTVDQTGGLNLSDESTGPWAAGFLSIASTGVYDITDDSAIVCNYTSGATITNAGLFEATVGTSTANINVDVTNTGTIEAVTGVLALQAGAELDGTIGAAKAKGLVQLDGGSFTTTKSLTIADEGASNVISVGGTTWTVSGVVTDNGKVGLINSGSLTIASAGVWKLDSADAGFNNSGGAIINNGMIDKIGSSVVNLTSAVTNDNLMDVQGGELKISAGVSGAGMIEVETGATLELAVNPSASQTIEFGGANGTLILDHPANFGGAIAGLGSGDTIDLVGITANGASVNSSNQLVVTENGTVVAKLKLSGTNTGLAFATIAVSGGTDVVALPAPATVVDYLDATAFYDLIAGGFGIIDTAAHISAALNSLDDSHINTITVSDNAPIVVSVAQLTSDATAIGKLGNANATPYRLAVSDTAADISAALNTLDGAHIASITIVDNEPITLSIAQLTTDAIAITKLVDANGSVVSLAVVDTAADISAALNTLNAANIASITISNNAAIGVSVAELKTDALAIGKLVNQNGAAYQLAVTDTAANISKALNTLNGAHIASITISNNSSITLSIAQMSEDAVAISKLADANASAPTLAIVDTAADITAALNSLNAANIASITISNNSPITVSIAQMTSDAVAIGKLVYANTAPGQIAVSDIGANITAALNNLNGANIASITISDDSAITVSIAQMSSDATAIAKLVNADETTGELAVVDTAADIAAALDTLDAANIASITISDNGAIGVSVAQLTNDAAAISELANQNETAYQLAVTDTAADISAALDTLDGANIASITISDNNAVTVSIAQMASDAAAIGKLVNANATPYQLDVKDTAANIAAAASTLEADLAHIASIASTTGAVAVSAANFLADSGALDKIVGGYAISDSLANIFANISAFNADADVISLIGSSGSATLASVSAIDAASFAVSGSGTKLTFAESLAYSGAFTLGAGSTVSVSAGDMFTLSGASTVDGAMNGAGELLLTGGTETIGGSAALGIATWDTQSETINLGVSLAYAHTFMAGAGDMLDMSGGALTLSGKTTLTGGATTSGAHALDLNGATTITGALTIDGTGGISVGGAVNDSGGNITLGDSAGDAVKLTIAKGGSWDFTDDFDLLLGASASSSIANAGLFEKTGGSEVTDIAAAIANTGKIEAAAATLDLLGAITGTGSDMVSGAATLEFSASVAAGQALSFAGSGGTLELLNPHAFSAKISDFDMGGASGDSLVVGTPWTYVGFSEATGSASGTMTFADGATKATLTLLGDYVASDFTPKTNANGQTVVTYT